MLSQGGFLMRNASLKNSVYLTIRVNPHELTTLARAKLLRSHVNLDVNQKFDCVRKFNTCSLTRFPVYTEDEKKSKGRSRVQFQGLFDDKDYTVNYRADYNSSNTRDIEISEETNVDSTKRSAHHVRSKERYNVRDVEKMYKNPKAKLHEIYQTVSSELKKECLEFEFTPASSKVPRWTCTAHVTWPESLSFSAVASNKSLAAHTTALKVLHWLENQKKLSDGKPVIYSSSDIQDIVNQPVKLEIGADSLNCIKSIVEKYENEVKDSIDNFEVTDSGKSSEYFESYFKPGAIVDPVGMSNPANRTPEKIAERNAMLQSRYEHRIMSSSQIDLPIVDFREIILNEIEQHQVVLIKGDTGCGKTTQVPQYIMDSFAKLGKATKCNMIISQPRRISAISLAERVAYERREQVGDVVGYQVRLAQEFPNTPAGMLFCTTGILLRKLQFNPSLEGCSHVIIDEAHERTVNTDMLLVLLKRAMSKNKDLKVIIMSATINAELFQNYFNSRVINVPGRTFPVTAHFLEDIDKLDLSIQNRYGLLNFDEGQAATIDSLNESGPVLDAVKIGELIAWITINKPPGAILCFLPGWAEIAKMKRYLEEFSSLAKRSHDILIVPVHSKMSHYDQRKIFHKPPNNVRKIVLATDIAETGITVADVVYVVDSCIQRQIEWLEKRGTSAIRNHWASQANIMQRKGRAGRVKPGVSYHFVTREMFDQLEPYPVPEIKRCSLEKTVLDAKTYSHEKAQDFFGSMPEPPQPSVIHQAVRDLFNLGALDYEENLTALGKRIALFTVHPKLSKAILYSAIFQCVSPVITIASVMSSESDVFTGVLQNKGAIRDVKRRYHPTSDHSSIAWLFQQWNSHNNSDPRQARDFCFKSRLYPERVYTLSKVRQLNAEHLVHARMIDNFREFDDFNAKINEYAELDELVRGVLLSGLDQIIHRRNFDVRKGYLKKGVDTFVTENGNRATITPDSVNFKRKDWPSPYLTYVQRTHSEERRSLLIRETSMVSPLTVFLFSQAQMLGYLNETNSPVADGDDREKKELQRILFLMKGRKNVKFDCDNETANVLLKFRDIMWSVVRYMVTNQGLIKEDQHEAYEQINEYKGQILQVLGQILSESAEFIDNPKSQTEADVSNSE